MSRNESLFSQIIVKLFFTVRGVVQSGAQSELLSALSFFDSWRVPLLRQDTQTTLVVVAALQELDPIRFDQIDAAVFLCDAA